MNSIELSTKTRAKAVKIRCVGWTGMAGNVEKKRNDRDLTFVRNRNLTDSKLDAQNA